MTHLLHIDSSVQGDRSVSRALTARAAQRWRAAHPGGTVTYRDLAAEPLPHLNPQNSADLSARLVDEVKAADTVLLGLPLYNFGPPSTVKAWVDHIVAAGLSFDAATGEGLLGDTRLLAIETRGGGYGPGTPREGWDHAQTWLTHGVSLTGLQPRFIVVELTLAESNPAMAELKPLAAQSLAAGQAEIDRLWAAEESVA
ncbi:NAD(P)H-dependent oxidoreductase [Mycolicibacterium rufum]|uniref:FMN dependent NADH:quinone oxidoreductase n=1 Tax=Mycolicibacterium rufum TaxID=318424 RepID=A0A9X2YEA4_9MYCO|nr:NAD(P)H-dependent oxidoreductase [Mycolicibacterium rufum]KGI69955.1 FMN-dependent NADH-azoreductase [Mycolicibacterium rufum]MCV7071869.1 NAD(P)H-dependent oxidoreductase [Mycolicibacterium rufum]ULP36208.1 NAD(P)H-dependent oxidoreductase [Mycolicibacterium rufum]